VTNEYALANTCTGQDTLTAQQVNGFAVSALSLFDEAENMQALAHLLSS